MYLEIVLVNRKFWRKGINDKLKFIYLEGGGLIILLLGKGYKIF